MDTLVFMQTQNKKEYRFKVYMNTNQTNIYVCDYLFVSLSLSLSVSPSLSLSLPLCLPLCLSLSLCLSVSPFFFSFSHSFYLFLSLRLIYLPIPAQCGLRSALSSEYHAPEPPAAHAADPHTAFEQVDPDIEPAVGGEDWIVG